jgi:hypothetical protein
MPLHQDPEDIEDDGYDPEAEEAAREREIDRRVDEAVEADQEMRAWLREDR